MVWLFYYFSLVSSVSCKFLSLFIVYFDADDSCHELTFNIGQNGVGATAATNRYFSIKVICYTSLNISVCLKNPV